MPSVIKKILPLTELTGVRPGEEGKSPGSATKAKLENTNVKEGKKAMPTVNFLINIVKYALHLSIGKVQETEEEENAEICFYVWLCDNYTLALSLIIILL